jgi:hypothetical protein
MYGGEDVYIHIFLTSRLVGGEWLASFPQPLYPLPPLDKTGLEDVDRRKIMSLSGLKL